MQERLLEIIEKDARYDVDALAAQLGAAETDVRACLQTYETEKIILGHKTVINWEKTDKERVTALIEVKVTPQRERGFDKLAERIYLYPEVKSLFLMSGGFDFTVIIEGKTMKEVALFVAEKLAPMDGVQSTSTHFVLKKYKENDVDFTEEPADTREVITL